MKRTLLMIIVSLLAGTACAEDSDSDLVHGLAHGCGGAMVAMATDIGPMDYIRYGMARNQRKLSWYVPVLVETGLAFLADEFYEVGTEKVPTVLAQHNLDASVAAALYSVRVSVQF